MLCYATLTSRARKRQHACPSCHLLIRTRICRLGDYQGTIHYPLGFDNEVRSTYSTDHRSVARIRRRPHPLGWPFCSLFPNRFKTAVLFLLVPFPCTLLFASRWPLKLALHKETNPSYLGATCSSRTLLNLLLPRQALAAKFLPFFLQRFYTCVLSQSIIGCLEKNKSFLSLFDLRLPSLSILHN